MSEKSIEAPAWALERLTQLRQVEEVLGNIPKSKDWKSDYLENVQKKVAVDQSHPISEETAEHLFQKIVKALSAEKYSVNEITEIINNKMRYPDGLPYCDLTDVEECL